MEATGAPLVAGSQVFVADKSGVLRAFATGGPVATSELASSESADPGVAPWFHLGLAIVIAGVYVIRRRQRASV